MIDPFEWSIEAQRAFNKVKEALTTTLVLFLSDFTLLLTLEMDTSGISMGAVLSHKGHPIAFFSKPFTILTDHHNLQELMTQVVQTPEQ